MITTELEKKDVCSHSKDYQYHKTLTYDKYKSNNTKLLIFKKQEEFDTKKIFNSDKGCDIIASYSLENVYFVQNNDFLIRFFKLFKE